MTECFMTRMLQYLSSHNGASSYHNHLVHMRIAEPTSGLKDVIRIAGQLADQKHQFAAKTNTGVCCRCVTYEFWTALAVERQTVIGECYLEIPRLAAARQQSSHRMPPIPIGYPTCYR